MSLEKIEANSIGSLLPKTWDGHHCHLIHGILCLKIISENLHNPSRMGDKLQIESKYILGKYRLYMYFPLFTTLLFVSNNGKIEMSCK